jgi:hypothetical protein
MSRQRKLRRRDFLALAAAGATSTARLRGPQLSIAAVAADPVAPLSIGPGPQLVLDEDLFERFDRVERTTEVPQRLPGPVLDSRTFGVTQPYLTVLRDPECKKFRAWYNHGPEIWHAESDDGTLWRSPQVVWALPRGYGCSLVDDGPATNDPSRRFKLANWQATRSKEDTPEDDAGMWVGFSPDGLRWTGSTHNPVLKTWPEGPGRFTRHGVGDTVDVFVDPIRKRYGAMPKVHALESDGWPAAPKAGRAFRRLVGVTHSADFERWTTPDRALVPDEQDDGLLEFYGVGGVHARGRLLIGFARILRDDLPCNPNGPVDGIGYSALVTSLDGIRWRRFRQPFLDRNPAPASWDHAMCWMSAVVPVGDTLHLYYGGYARGHKVAPQTERQIGMATIPVDRYAGVQARDQGSVTTRPFRFAGTDLSVNYRSEQGELTVRLLDERGEAIAGFDHADCRPVRGDQISTPVRWTEPLGEQIGKIVQIEFRLRRATLYAFDVVNSSR